MTTTAIAMLVVAALIVWGGLIGSVLLLRNHPEELELPETGGYPDGEPHRQRRNRSSSDASHEYQR